MVDNVTLGLKRRIKNNLNELTGEELVIIVGTSELSDFLAQEIIAQENPAILLKSRESIIEEFFTEQGRKYKRLGILYAAYYCASHLEPVLSIFSNFAIVFDLNQEDLSLCEEKFEQFLNTDTCSFADKIHEDSIIFLLDTKRYNLFPHLKEKTISISDETYNRFINEYPENTTGFLFITQYLLDRDLTDKIPIKDLVDYCNYLLKEKINIKDGNKSYEVLYNRLNNLDNITELGTDISWPVTKLSLKFFNDYDLLVWKIYQKGYIIDAYCLFCFPLINPIQLKQDLLRVISSKEATLEYKKSILTEHTNDIKYTNFLDDEELVRSLAENDCLEIVFTLYPYYVIEKHYEIIKKAIIEGKAQTFLSHIGKHLEFIPSSILQAMIDNQLITKVTGIKIDEKCGNNELSNQIYILLDNDIEIEANVSDYAFVGTALFEKLVEKEKWDILCHLDSELIARETVDFVKGINSSVLFATKMIDSHSRYVIEHPDILDAIVQNDVYTALLINKLNHDEYMEDLYSDELFNKLKNYFHRKYNFDLEKLELLERQCGPTIIRYIDNENIGALLELPKETIAKIIALFPKARFTMDELRSSYDSLVQYSFAQKRPKQCSLFANLKQAIQANNMEIINDCKQELLNSITPDAYIKFRIKKAKEKVIIPEESLLEFLNNTISEILLGNNVAEKLDLLHSIFIEYVGIERKKYHNYHFFEKLHIDYANLYQAIIEAVAKEDNDSLNSIYNKYLKRYLTNSFYKRVAKRFGENAYNPDPEELIKELYVDIADPEKKSSALIFLRFLTDYICERKKSDEIKKVEFGEELKIPYYLDKRSLERAIEKEIILGGNYYIKEETSEIKITKLLAQRLPTAIDAEYTSESSSKKEKLKELFGNQDFLELLFNYLKRPDIYSPYLSKIIVDRFNENNQSFREVIYQLKNSGQIPEIGDYPPIQVLKNTKIYDGTSVYDYLNNLFSVDAFYMLREFASIDGYVTIFKELIPIIIKCGKEIIKDREVIVRTGINEKKSVSKAILDSYLKDITNYYLEINGSLVLFAKELYKQLTTIYSYNEERLARYLLTGTIDSLLPDEKEAVQKLMKSYVSDHKIVAKYRESESMGETIIEVVDKTREANRVYVADKTEMDPYEILANLDLELLIKSVLTNDSLYQQLLKVAKTKKICSIPPSINRLMESLGIDMQVGASDIAAFISNFANVIEAEKEVYRRAEKEVPDEIPFTMYNILAEAASFGASSSVYAQILGKEDARLIKGNPKPNPAIYKLKNNERQKEAVCLALECFRRQGVTVPPLRKVYNTSSGKELKAACGNFTNPYTLTHGERSGSCMRIGGVGESLFYFALRNINGFHISFEDPETGKYVSRVTGFRNGNTVFLNELRNSCIDKYNDKDVYEACRQMAQDLIELSKDSAYPIENVVISSDYAMQHSGLKKVDLNVNNIKEGLYEGKNEFYSDVTGVAIVLATTSTSAFAPVKLDKSQVPLYPTLRGEIKKIIDAPKMLESINRVISIQALNEGKTLDDIALNAYKMNDGFIEGYASDDWFAYINEKKEIKYCSINIDSRAKDELEECLSSLRKSLGEETETYAI